MSQKDIFLASEGDAYFSRNVASLDHEDHITLALQRLQIRPRRILEIGCSDGGRLVKMREAFGSECFGIDPSREAINAARSKDLHLSIGTADRLEYDDASFDFVLFGFCLYLCDPQDHFIIAAEANRVLQNGGLVGIYDFCSTRPYRNAYSHKPGLYSHKMEYANMFLWHPGYRLLSRSYYELGRKFTYMPDEAVSIDLLRKDFVNAFPSR